MHTDDFKLIHGIGPGIEKRLHEAGVHTYEHLASLSPADVVALLGRPIGLTPARVTQQNWIGQARELAPDEPAETAAGREPAPDTSQHYATFMFELLLDPDNGVRRTHVVHVQSGEDDTWAGWQERRLRGFIGPHAALPPADTAAPPVVHAVDVGSEERVGALGQDVAAPDLAMEPAGGAAIRPPAGTASAPAGPGVRAGATTGTPRVRALLTPDHPVTSGQPFEVRLVLDLSGLDVPAGTEIDYRATVWVRSLDGRIRQELGQADGTTGPTDSLAVVVPAVPLPANIYRLEAIASVALPGPAPIAAIEGGLFQVL